MISPIRNLNNSIAVDMKKLLLINLSITILSFAGIYTPNESLKFYTFVFFFLFSVITFGSFLIFLPSFIFKARIYNQSSERKKIILDSWKRNAILRSILLVVAFFIFPSFILELADPNRWVGNNFQQKSRYITNFSILLSYYLQIKYFYIDDYKLPILLVLTVLFCGLILAYILGSFMFISGVYY